MCHRIILVLTLAVLSIVAVACSGGSDGPFNRFTGSVLDSKGNPIPDMTVLVNGNNTGITSNSQGSFTLAPTNFNKGIDSPNRISIGDGGVIIASREIVPMEMRNFVFQFPRADGPTGDVMGLVFDNFEAKPLADVKLILFNPELGLFRTLSGQDGGFYFDDVPAGKYRLTARLPKYHAGIALVDVQPGDQTYQGIALQPYSRPHFQEGVMVSGHIVDSKSGWGIDGASVTMVVETGYIGIPEPWMEDNGLPKPSDPMPPIGDPGSSDFMSPPVRYDPQYQETITLADGYFEFPEPAVGYGIYLNFWKDGYLSGSYYLDIYGLEEDVVLSLELTPLVMTSANGKVIDENSQPVKGAHVEFIFAGAQMPFYNDGPMLGLPNDPGWDGFEFMAGQNEGAGGSAPTPPPGYGGDDPRDFNPLDNPVMQRYRWENQNRREGSGFGSDVPFTGFYSTNTNDNGEFSFAELPVGAYYVFVSAYKHLSINTEIETVEEPASNYFEFVCENIPVGSVMGVVKDEHGILVADALVNCVQPRVDPFTYTNSSGEFRIDNVPTGRWIVSAFKYGFITDSREVVIGEDQVVTVNLNLQSYTPPNVQTVHFTGRVIDGITGEGIEGARMIFTTADNQFFFDATSYTDGFYSAELIATEYMVLIQHPEYQDLYIGFYVDSLYPELDFSLWSIYGGIGPWGGIIPGAGGRGWGEDEVWGDPTTGGDESPSQGGYQGPPDEFDPLKFFEDRR